MKLTIKKSGHVRTYHFEGSLTLEWADKIQLALSKPFRSQEERVLSVKEATEVDLSFLQLLCSAHRTSVRENASLVIDRNQPELFRRVVKEAGFVRSECCPLNTKKSGCLWVEEHHE